MSDTSETYLVWSNEHRGWWKPGGYGYSPGLRGAGHFTREHALRICREALPTAAHIGLISEVPVRMADLAEVLKDQVVPIAVYGAKR
jgi:hypothetical protein